MNGECKALRESETSGLSLRDRNILASFLDFGTELGDGSRDTDISKVFNTSARSSEKTNKQIDASRLKIRDSAEISLVKKSRLRDAHNRSKTRDCESNYIRR